jgi:hypothetical protein
VIGEECYVTNVTSYDTYGAVAGGVLLLFWLHLAALIIFTCSRSSASTPALSSPGSPVTRMGCDQSPATRRYPPLTQSATRRA